jgi:hypothetical protein
MRKCTMDRVKIRRYSWRLAWENNCLTLSVFQKNRTSEHSFLNLLELKTHKR